MIRRLAKLQPYVLFLLRLTVGASLVYHSWSKTVPDGSFRFGHILTTCEHFYAFVVTPHLGRWLSYVLTVTEFFGGIAIFVGLFTRIWSLVIAVDMLIAIISSSLKGGLFGSELSLAVGVMALMLLVAGAGAWSLDRRFGFA